MSAYLKKGKFLGGDSCHNGDLPQSNPKTVFILIRYFIRRITSYGLFLSIIVPICYFVHEIHSPTNPYFNI